VDTHGHTTEWILPRPDEYSVFFLHIGFLYSPPACEKNIPQDRLLTFAIGYLLVAFKILGVLEHLQNPTRLVVEVKCSPIAWDFHTTGNTYFPPDWEGRGSGYDPGVHTGKSLSSSACVGISYRILTPKSDAFAFTILVKHIEAGMGVLDDNLPTTRPEVSQHFDALGKVDKIASRAYGLESTVNGGHSTTLNLNLLKVDYAPQIEERRVESVEVLTEPVKPDILIPERPSYHPVRKAPTLISVDASALPSDTSVENTQVADS
jgi:hypothetical protein